MVVNLVRVAPVLMIEMGRPSGSRSRSSSSRRRSSELRGRAREPKLHIQLRLLVHEARAPHRSILLLNPEGRLQP